MNKQIFYEFHTHLVFSGVGLIINPDTVMTTKNGYFMPINQYNLIFSFKQPSTHNILFISYFYVLTGSQINVIYLSRWE